MITMRRYERIDAVVIFPARKLTPSLICPGVYKKTLAWSKEWKTCSDSLCMQGGGGGGVKRHRQRVRESERERPVGDARGRYAHNVPSQLYRLPLPFGGHTPKDQHRSLCTSKGSDSYSFPSFLLFSVYVSAAIHTSSREKEKSTISNYSQSTPTQKKSKV